jgi:hypothetical protein
MKALGTLCASLAFLAMSACGGGSTAVDTSSPVDFSGSWAGPCLQADTSAAALLEDVYYFDTLTITDTSMTTGGLVFTDSDCVTPFIGDYRRNSAFDVGNYTTGSALTTESGLTAYPLEIQDTESDAAFSNIIALVDEVLYFGFNPIEGPSETAPASLNVLDLENGFRRR